MTTAKHTSGPWVWSGLQLLASRDMHSETVLIAEGAPFEPSEADKRLIEAAPDLYRELSMQVRNCPVCKGDGVAVDVMDMLTQKPPHELKPCNRCASSREALARAAA